ncbi:MAG TPA: amino acid racemase [Gemmatimonadaceae bacterium]
MTRLGLVGGLGPESTIDYYCRILDGWKATDPASSPSIVIDSLDVRRALDLVAHDREALTEYLLASVGRLTAAGADFVAISANTPHLVFDALAARAQVPLLSIVETCADEASRRGLRRVLLLGTRFTMEAPFYPDVFARRGIDVVVPLEEDRGWIHGIYVGELLRGEFHDSTRKELVSIIERMRRAEEIDGVILGGTELPLLVRGREVANLPILDTTALHVSAIVKRLRAGAPAAS